MAYVRLPRVIVLSFGSPSSDAELARAVIERVQADSSRGEYAALDVAWLVCCLLSCGS